MIRLLLYAQSAFTLWMLVDAGQRRVPYYWWIVIFMEPVGPWIYFFVVKIHDIDTRWFQHHMGVDMNWLTRLLHPAPTTDQLRYRHRINPCLENKASLAKRLYDENEYAEASSLFTEALQMDREDRDSLYCLGLCKAKLEKFNEAIECFSQVIKLDRRFHDYTPWEDLAGVYWMNGQKDETIRILEELQKTNPNIKNATLLANYLMQLQQKDKARNVLSDALEDFQHAPSYVRRSNGRWAGEAREMLKSLN